jgi:hypothetical protein
VKWKDYEPKYSRKKINLLNIFYNFFPDSWEPKKGLENLEVFKEWEAKQKENEGENGSDDDEDEEDEEDGYYKVEQILDRKMDKKGKIKYFIKWEGKNNRW